MRLELQNFLARACIVAAFCASIALVAKPAHAEQLSVAGAAAGLVSNARALGNAWRPAAAVATPPQPEPNNRGSYDSVDNRNILTRSFFISLLLGNPFSGLGLLDILIMGAAIFFIFRATRPDAPSDDAAGQKTPSPDSTERRYGPGPESQAFKRASQAWDMLRSRASGQAPEQTPGPKPSPPKSPNNVPASGPPSAPSPSPQPRPLDRTASHPVSADQEEFLRGAKIVYSRIHDSLVSTDLADVKHFTSALMFEELKPLSGRPLGQIVRLEASLLDMRTEAGVTQARVQFEILLQKEGSSEPPSPVRDVWRFHRDAGDPASTWRLTAIER